MKRKRFVMIFIAKSISCAKNFKSQLRDCRRTYMLPPGWNPSNHQRNYETTKKLDRAFTLIGLCGGQRAAE